ncbi:MAG: hypothetical protein KF861_23730, partial [Planctomycetaceae bacterium]|nr:hypothetical protein [Planctomycetaceae bacterium]
RNDLLPLASVGPDIVAVRSAVCCGDDRRAVVSAERIADLKRTIAHLPWAGMRARDVVTPSRSLGAH